MSARRRRERCGDAARRGWWFVCGLAVCALPGCGGDGAPGGARDGTGSSGATGHAAGAVEASAEAVAREARRGLRCPPRVRLPGRSADAPVDDIRDVRPGMSLTDARALILCSDERLVPTLDSSNRFGLETFGRRIVQGLEARVAAPRVTTSGEAIMREMQERAMARATNRVVRDVGPGEVAWSVGVLGPAGEERVTDIALEEWFDTAAAPTMQQVAAALAGKYGPPSVERGAGGSSGAYEVWWLRTPDGRPVDDGPASPPCLATARRTAGVTFRSDCGLVVAAWARPRRDNPLLAEQLHVRVLRGDAGHAWIEAVRDTLGARETRRRAEEAGAAAARGRGPIL